MTTLVYESPSTDSTFEQAMQHRWNRLSTDQVRRHVQRQLGNAGIPAAYQSCSFKSLDAGKHPDAFRCGRKYAEKGEYDGKRGLLRIGRPGRGKTSLAVAILRRRVEQTRGRYGVRFWNVPRGLVHIRDSFNRSEKERESLLDLIYPRLVVLDDLGQQRMTEWVAEQFYNLIDGLLAEEKQVVITTNLPPDALEKGLDEALMSRILEMCYVVSLKGKDLRL